MSKYILHRRGWALLLLAVLYGLCFVGLQDLAPDLVIAFVALTLGVLLLISIGRQGIEHNTLLNLLKNVFLFPVSFYRTGIEASTATQSTALSMVISAALCAGVGFVLLMLAVVPVIAIIIAVPLAGMAFFAWNAKLDPLIVPRRFFVSLKTAPSLSETPLPHLRWGLVTIEMAIIVVTTVLITRPFYESPSTWQISGNEAEWLTSSVYAARAGLVESGRIPRWQPYLEQGEPLIENPFNFIFNPIVSAPSLLIGPVMGLRISVILSYFLAGLGGWFLGRGLGFESLARVLLALLLMGKGNLHAMLNSGYFQLALSQIYMPYVIGGIIALFRWPQRRWPVVLTGLSLALQFLSGNIWYVLPTAVGAICVGVVLLIGTGKRWVDLTSLKRLILAAVFTVGLSAVVALPVLLEFKQVGRHPDEIDGGWFVPTPEIVQLYFDPSPTQLLTISAPAIGEFNPYRLVKELDEFYYSYITPFWYLLFVLVAMPLYRPAAGRERRVWWVALILTVLATLWGAGGKQPILWLYQNIPALAQWRFVGRALAVATFWLAVMVAMRVDNLWRHITTADWASLLHLNMRWAKPVPIVLGGVVLVATLIAGADVNDQWYKMDKIVTEMYAETNACITWLRSQYPDRELAVWQQQYLDITTYLNNRVRTWSIGADFEMLAQPNTIGNPHLDLNKVLPQFAIIGPAAQLKPVLQDGYQMMADSPPSREVRHCLYEQTNATLPYAYSVSRAALEAMNQPITDPSVEVTAFSPVPLFERRGDQVALVVTAKRTVPTIIGVQEKAYPGWRVEVDGKAAPLESVGGQIGVLLPAGDQPLQIYFVYDPVLPVIGGWLTLITSVVCIGYLVTDRRKPKSAANDSLSTS